MHTRKLPGSWKLTAGGKILHRQLAELLFCFAGLNWGHSVYKTHTILLSLSPIANGRCFIWKSTIDIIAISEPNIYRFLSARGWNKIHCHFAMNIMVSDLGEWKGKTSVAWTYSKPGKLFLRFVSLRCILLKIILLNKIRVQGKDVFLHGLEMSAEGVLPCS